MAYDPEQEEQLENLKAFWNRYGNFILTVLMVVAVAFAGWRGWQWYEHHQVTQASQLYDELGVAAGAKDVDKVRDVAGRIFSDYSRTAWAQMAALVAADVYLETGDPKAAKVPLRWAIENARDPGFSNEARLRLAGILLDEKAFDEGLAVLAQPTESNYAGAFADRRGDLLTAKGESAQARAAYKEALDRLNAASPLRQLVQIKLDALGGDAA
jgi:predicted negative regulator of RcsB-dependent stress response